MPTERLHACLTLLMLALLAGCGPHRTPPETLLIGSLPVSGTIADARRAGFTNCSGDPVSLRCRRAGVMLAGQGPYQAAVDLVGRDGSGGFDQLILWHDTNQAAVQEVGDVLELAGWQVCLTGEGARGDQEIYVHAHARIRVAIDISYWGKRRLRLIPERNGRKPRC